MDFELPEHTRAIKRLVRQLVERYAMPMEQKFLRGEVLADEEGRAASKAAADAGLWGLNLSKDLGGAELSTIDNVVVTEENNPHPLPDRLRRPGAAARGVRG